MGKGRRACVNCGVLKRELQTAKAELETTRQKFVDAGGRVAAEGQAAAARAPQLSALLEKREQALREAQAAVDAKERLLEEATGANRLAELRLARGERSRFRHPRAERAPAAPTNRSCAR